MSSYPGIYQYKSGFGRVSLFQMFNIHHKSCSITKICVLCGFVTNNNNNMVHNMNNEHTSILP